MKMFFRPKLFSVLKQGYTKKALTKDLFAGLIVGIVALPLAIAFAVASGVSPEKGLITAVIAGFVISLLGGSRVQIGGPTGAFVVIVYGIIEKYGFDGLIISTVLAGIILVCFGLLRLGSIIKYIPISVVVGFTSGIAVTIFSSQIKDAFGMPIAKVPSDFIAKWDIYLINFLHTNYIALLLTVSTILIGIYFKKITTKIPGSFVAIILITAVVSIFKLPVNTIQTVFGAIPNHFDFQLPKINFEMIKFYIQPAITIALLGAIESLLSAVVADGMIGGNHRSNTELIAQGIANIVTPFFGGIPATGAIARTATNVKNGGRSPIAGMVHALVLLLIMLFFGKWALLIPLPCLAGILIVVAYNMSEWRSFLSICRGSKYDIAVLIATFLLTVLVDLTVAIEVGMVLATLLFLQRMIKISNMSSLENDGELMDNYSDIPNDIEIYEVSGPFFFGAAKRYSETLKEVRTKSKVIILRMRHVPFIDATGVHNLKETIKELHSSKKKIILSGVQAMVKEELVKGGIIDLIGKDFICDNFDDTIEKAKDLISVKIPPAEKWIDR